MNDTIKYKGYSIEIKQDSDPLNPRTDYDNLATMCCYHSNYNLGDKQDHNSNASTVEDEARYKFAFDADVDLEEIEQCGTEQEIDAAHRKIDNWIRKNTVLMELYLFDHSGLSISVSPFGCGWDSGTVGFIYITKDQMTNNFGGKYFTKGLRERAAEIIRAEVELYDQFLTGDVYYVGIESLEIGCGSFFGYDHDKSGALEYARIEIDYHIEYQRKRKQKVIKSLARNHVPLQNRAQILNNVGL